MSDRIIFGYNEKEYRASDMLEMSAEEYEKHKEHMRGLVKSMGMNEEKSSIRISDPYKSEQSGEVFIYASESRELKGKTLTQMNRRYSLGKTEGTGSSPPWNRIRSRSAAMRRRRTPKRSWMH